MSLYKRNEIIIVNSPEEDIINEPCIYCSYKNKEDDVYDYLPLSDKELSKILLPTTLAYELNFDNNSPTKNSLSIQILVLYRKNIDPESILLRATINGALCNYNEKIELQEFVDTLTKCRYDEDIFEEADNIKVKIKSLYKQISIYNFEENGNVMTNVPFPLIGYIYNKNMEIIGVIDCFKVISYNDSLYTIEFNDVVTYTSLNNLEVNKIVFPGDNYLVEIRGDIKVIKSDEDILRNYTITSDNFISFKKVNKVDLDKVPREDNFMSMDKEEIFDSRVKMLVSRDSFFGTSNEQKFESILDDFDF